MIKLKATRDFYERFQKMKLYKKGDPYSNDDLERISFLEENGYLEDSKPKESKEVKAPTKKKGD